MANAWSKTVAQFGIAPIFPPQEDVRVGDLYAVMGEQGDNWRISLKAHRAIRLGHLNEIDVMLEEPKRQVVILPKSPPDYAAARARVAPVDCAEDCIVRVGAKSHLPVVVLPGISAAQLRRTEAQGGWWSSATRSIFGGLYDDSQTVSVEIPYAEVYGLSSLEASKALQDYCEKTPKLDFGRLCGVAGQFDQC